MTLFFKTVMLISLLHHSVSLSGEIYKYKDESGKWVFSDKKPTLEHEIEKVEYRRNEKEVPKPRAYVKNMEGGYALVFHNPYYAPVEVALRSSIFGRKVYKETVVGNTKKTLYKSADKIPRYKYKWTLGDPKARVEDYLYRFPVSSKGSHLITQSFNGRRTHSKSPNIYAVDIAMPVGTYISAARSGTVIWVKDDYPMGGKSSYFLDKANYVKVLHDDGSYAVYAHILEGGSLVKPGDRIDVGERLARSGSSGYSTGPHLHFVIRKNAGLKRVSIPFRFKNESGDGFIPQKGMKIVGTLN